jgi:outer membrane protein assembly factor BamB
LLAHEFVRQPLQRSMLQDANRSFSLPDDRRHVSDIEARDDAQQHHLGLLGREASDESKGRIRLARRNCDCLGISRSIARRPDREVIVDGAPSTLAPTKVDQPPAGDREQPAPKAGLVSLEPPQRRRHIEPNLRCQILRVRRGLRPQVADETRVQLPVEGRDRPLGPGRRRGEDRLKLLSEWHDDQKYRRRTTRRRPCSPSARSISRVKAAATALATIVLALVGCSGGSGEGGITTRPPTTVTTSARPPTTSESAPGGSVWPMFGVEPARSNRFEGPTGISGENVGRLERRQVPIPGTADSSPILLPSGLLVMTTSYGKAVAVDPQSAEIRWTFVPDGIEAWEGSSQITQASPLFADGSVYSYSPDGRVHKLDARNGREVRSEGWPVTITKDPSREKSAPPLNLAGGLVLAATGGYFGDAPPYQGHVVAIDADSGRIVNVFNTLCADRKGLLDPPTCQESGSAIWGRGGVVVAPGTGNLLVSTGNGEWDGSRHWGDSVLELSPDAGRLLASFTPENEAELDASDLDLSSASPAIVPLSRRGTARFVVQGGKEGVLYLLDARTLSGRRSPGGTGGALAAVAAPGGTGVFSAPAVWARAGDAMVFVATSSGTAAYRVRDNPPRIDTLWENDSAGTSPVLAGGLLYVYDPGGGLHVYDPETGHRFATLEAGPGHWSSPIVADGIVALPEGNSNDHRTEGILNLYRLPS